MTARLPDTSIWGRNAGENPLDPFDPWKPRYPGKADIVLPYRSSLEERVLALAVGALAAAAPGVTVPLPKPRPRLPGESPDYFKRTAEGSPARPVEHQWMLGDPRIGQKQTAPDVNGDPEAAATFDERWVSGNPRVGQSQSDPNLVRRPVGRNDVPPAPNRTEPSGTPLPRTRPAFLEHPPETVAALEGLDPAAAQMWSDNAAALRAKGIEIGISSGRRGATHNTHIRGAKASQHLQGKATDIKLEGLSTEQRQAVVSQFLSDPRVNGFGFYPEKDAIHVDVRSGKRYAWGHTYSWKSIGVGWPKWLTDQVREWLKNAPTRGPRQ